MTHPAVCVSATGHEKTHTHGENIPMTPDSEYPSESCSPDVFLHQSLGFEFATHRIQICVQHDVYGAKRLGSCSCCVKTTEVAQRRR